jgi:hypothetical protein
VIPMVRGVKRGGRQLPVTRIELDCWPAPRSLKRRASVARPPKQVGTASSKSVLNSATM